MAFTFVNESSYNASGNNKIPISKPSGTIDGDIMIATLCSQYTVSSAPLNWNQLCTAFVAASFRQYIYWKIASSEGSSYEWAFGGNAQVWGTIGTYRGTLGGAGSPIDVYSNTLYSTAGKTVRGASMSVTSPNSFLVGVATSNRNGSDSMTKPTVPTSDWVEDCDVTNGLSWGTRSFNHMTWTGYGATGNMDWTVSTSGVWGKHAFVIALKPPPEGYSRSLPTFKQI